MTRAKIRWLQGLCDDMVKAINHLRQDLPVLDELAQEWERGPRSQRFGAALSTGSGWSNPTETMAQFPEDRAEDNPADGVTKLIEDLNRVAEEVLGSKKVEGLERQRKALMPVAQNVAKRLAEGDNPSCRLHAQVNSTRVVYSPLTGLCRTCFEFKEEWGQEPPLSIVRKWAEMRKVNRTEIELALMMQEEEHKRPNRWNRAQRAG